jgi:cell division control protein 6
LLQGYNGRNLFVYGAPGIGKTTACKHVLRELENETEDIIPLYINCWKENTTYKIFYKICEELGFKFIQNQKTSDLFNMIKVKLNKKAVVFIFDEIDKLEELDFLYTILEDIYRKAIILITNYRDSYGEFDERIRSRLGPEFLCFRSYNEVEIAGILKQRRDFAFVQNCWDEEAFKEIVEKCLETKDLRIGLYLMRETGNIAEEKGHRQIGLIDVAEAIKKVEDFHIKPKEDLEEDVKIILELIKENSGKKIGEIYSTYLEMGGEISYKGFQRRITKLKEGKFITTDKVLGKDGNTTIINYSANKQLTEFGDKGD